MVLTRYAMALFGSAALLTAPAFAGISVSVGGGAGAHVGTPPIGTPNVGTPPIGTRQPIAAPPVSVPRADARASANANANSAVVAGLPFQATLTAVKGDTATIRQPNGAVRVYKISRQTAGALKSDIGKPLTFVARNDMLAIVQQGTLMAVNGTTAVVKLTDGATRTFSIGADESARLKSHVGKSIWIETRDRSHLTLQPGF